MDALRLNHPVDVAAAVQKLVGSEGFDGDKDVVNEVELSVILCPAGSIEQCSSLTTEKGITCSVNTFEPTSCDGLQNVELCRHSGQLPSFTCEDSYKRLCSGISSPSWTPRHEEIQIQKGAERVSRNNGGCSKRRKMAKLEDMTGPAGVDNTNDLSDKLGQCSTKCDSHEKTRVAKQRNNSSNKRVDRRTFKVSMKKKHGLFSPKTAFGCFSSSDRGDNILGLYGLKTDAHDITKLVDDLSLNDLLDGNYQCPSLGEDKRKKALDTSKSIIQSVRNGWSVLHSTPIDKIAPCSSSSVSIMSNGDNLDSSTADMSSSNKDCCSMPETPVNLLDFPLHQPKDTLELLALPPLKDLDSLLQDAAKSAVSSRNAADPRPGKQITRRVTLPPFGWSHVFNGHIKTNSDMAKLLSSRSTCQGRWVNIGNVASSHGAACESFMDLESLTYDDSLVPLYKTKPIALFNSVTSTPSFSSESGAQSVAASMASSVLLVEDCPRLLAAAQTLCDIATHISRPNQDGMVKWPKKPSQKTMKARKSKLTEKYEEKIPALTSSVASYHSVRCGIDLVIPSKRPKLLISGNQKDVGHINGVRRGLLNWSTPRSSRSSPKKSTQDTIGGTRHSTKLKEEPFMKLPPAKVPNRNCNGQSKVWKLTQVDCKRECED